MPETEFQKVLERVNADEDFRERFTSDIPGALAELDLSPTERAALVSTDEDALRRMPGGQIDIDPTAAGRSWLSRLLCSRWFCGPQKTRDWQCPKQP